MTLRMALETLLVCAALGGLPATAIETRRTVVEQKGPAMSGRASGTFEVTIKPLPDDEKVAGLKVGRVSIAKQFTGDLEGTSRGEMMTAETSVPTSGGYAAVEQVSGTLRGRTGTFALVHQGTMQKGGDFNLSIVVVPDSGTGQLTGLAGRMSIIIEGKKHAYDFDYTLP